MNLSHLPLRLAIGAFFLNSGLEKRTLEEQPAEAVHAMAVGAVPAFRKMKPAGFARFLAGSEIAVGLGLLIPVIPSALIGAGLCGFSAGLLRLYWATPGMHRPGDPRPTQQGVPLAKDVWLFGAGLTLILDDLARGRMLERYYGATRRGCAAGAASGHLRNPLRARPRRRSFLGR